MVQRCGRYNFVVFCMCDVSCMVVHTRARRSCECRICSAPMLTTLLITGLMAEEEGAVRMEGAERPPQSSRRCMWNGCGQEFTDLDDLVQHIESTHIEKGKTLCNWVSCSSCKPFNSRYKLLIHMRSHSGEKPHKCSVCAYFFSYNASLIILLAL